MADAPKYTLFSEGVQKIAIAVISSVFTFWMTSKAPDLRFSAGQVISYADEKEEFGIFTISMWNDGRIKADKVKCEIKISDSQIQSVKGPSFLDPDVKVSGDGKSATIFLPSLNAGEGVEFAVKATEPGRIAKSRTISVRGDDVVGIETSSKSTSGTQTILVVFGTWGLMFFFGGIVWLTLDGITSVKKKLQKRSDQRNPKKRFRFADGKSKNQIITGDDAGKLYSELSMQTTRLHHNGEMYGVWKRLVDDDGTVEFEMRTIW